MNIVILNWKDIKNPHVGGAELIAFEFAKRLVKDGHTVTFFCRSFPNAKSKEIIDGVHILRKGNMLTVYIHAYFYYASLQKKPDKVIDMINTIAWQTPLYVPSEKRIAYLNQLAQKVWYYEFPFPFSFLGDIFERFQYLSYQKTKFICYSQSTKQDLISYNISPKQIQVFPLGLDHKRYKPSHKKASFPLFLFVARLVRMKRADLCIEAIALVAKKYPLVKLYIIGNGPDEERLIRLCSKLAVEPNIMFVNKDNFFMSYSKKDQKLVWMQQAWALVLPSVKEGWGMVVTEAAACGTPAIVSNVTGLRDSVRKDKTGFILSESPTAKELATAMIRLIKDEKLRITMNTQAIEWSKNFTWEKSYQELRKLLIK